VPDRMQPPSLDAATPPVQELGTRTKVETVNAALREIAARRLRLAYLEATRNLDLSEENTGGAWR
jgi:hypothetical protein